MKEAERSNPLVISNGNFVSISNNEAALTFSIPEIIVTDNSNGVINKNSTFKSIDITDPVSSSQFKFQTNSNNSKSWIPLFEYPEYDT